MGSRPSPRDDIERILVTEQQLEAALDRLAESLTREVGGADPILIGVLGGVFVFLADLVRRLDFALEVDFIDAESYGEDTEAGELKIIKDVDCEIRGRHVVIVDDILDTGQTLSALVRMLQERGPASLRTCVLLDKPARRVIEFEADYVGVRIPNVFVVGYGLDFAQRYRNLPFVGVLRPELYDKRRT